LLFSRHVKHSAIEEFISKLSETASSQGAGAGTAVGGAKAGEEQTDVALWSEEAVAELDRRHLALLDEEYGASGRNGSVDLQSEKLPSRPFLKP
jgi:hypothetical protein